MARPHFRVRLDGTNPRVQTASGEFSPWQAGGVVSYEGAASGRRLRNFQPPSDHVNAAVQKSGRTLVKRARFLAENNGYAGNAVDVWVAWLIGDGLRPRIAGGSVERRNKLMSLFHRWAKECDADGQTNLYGLQAKAEAEAFIAGESFVRFHSRRAREMNSVGLQLEVLPSEMLDLNYNEDLPNGNQVRMGIEFGALNKRVAYHFWRVHPDDRGARQDFSADPRVRILARNVLHIMPGRAAGQIRGVSRYARAIVPIFSADIYDDAEIARKHTAALYAGFITKTGESSPLDGLDEDAEDDAIQMQPGAMVDLNEGENVEFSSPADVGGSYEPFQYRTTLRIAVALGIPYAYLTGDTTRGNFSNVRTEIMNFRRRLGQHQQLWTIPQLCGPIWHRFLDAVEVAGLAEVDPSDRNEDHGVPRSEWLDPRADIDAEIKAVRAGFKNRSHVISSLGYDREEIDRERVTENVEADRDKLVFDTDPRRVTSSGTSNAVATGSGYLTPDNELPDASEAPAGADETGANAEGAAQ